VEEWHIPRITASKYVSALPNANMDHARTECLTSGSLRNVSWVQKAASQLYRRNLSLLHMSTQCPDMSLHMISFTRPSPALPLQATNAGVRMPGYEATYLIESKVLTCPLQ